MGAMIWAAYERVSTEEQASEGHSIEVQKEGIERYLNTKGDRLFRHYTDAGISGATMERPELQALLEDARAGKFQGVSTTPHKRGHYSQVFLPHLPVFFLTRDTGAGFGGASGFATTSRAEAPI